MNLSTFCRNLILGSVFFAVVLAFMAYLLLCAENSMCSNFQTFGIPILVFLMVFTGGIVLIPILFIFNIMAKKKKDLYRKEKALFIIGTIETEFALWIILVLTKIFNSDLQSAPWLPFIILGLIGTFFLYHNVYKILTPTTFIKNPHQF